MRQKHKRRPVPRTQHRSLGEMASRRVPIAPECFVVRDHGSSSVIAVYSGRESFDGSTAAALLQSVLDFHFTLNSTASKTVFPGQSATFRFTIAPRGSFDNAIQFFASALPPGATASFDPQSVTPSAAPMTVVLTIKTAQLIAPARAARPFRATSFLLLGVRSSAAPSSGRLQSLSRPRHRHKRLRGRIVQPASRNVSHHRYGNQRIAATLDHRESHSAIEEPLKSTAPFAIVILRLAKTLSGYDSRQTLAHTGSLNRCSVRPVYGARHRSRTWNFISARDVQEPEAGRSRTSRLRNRLSSLTQIH